MVSPAIRRGAAKKLRANTTPHERILWRALKELPIEGTHFRRQAPIGPYVVDFFCPAKRLIVELDGGHHNEDATAARDSERQAWLEQEGVGLRSLHEALDTTTPSGKLTFHIFGALAEFERRRSSMRLSK